MINKPEKRINDAVTSGRAAKWDDKETKWIYSNGIGRINKPVMLRQ